MLNDLLDDEAYLRLFSNAPMPPEYEINNMIVPDIQKVARQIIPIDVPDSIPDTNITAPEIISTTPTPKSGIDWKFWTGVGLVLVAAGGLYYFGYHLPNQKKKDENN